MATDMEEETEIELIDSSTALMAINKSEIDQQIATAKRYPRSVTQFKRDAMELACLDEQTAETMFYVLPRAGKKIEGPSVRMAEVVGSSWGNLRYGARVASIDEKFVTAQGACFDLEKNISATVEVKRRITDKTGRRFNDDMIVVTSNAACSIALRQAIFKIVPFALIKPVYEQAKLTAIGKATSMSERRLREIEWFKKAGATQDQVLAALGRAGVDDITVEDLITLIGFRNAIKEGESTIENVLGPVPDTKKKAAVSDLNSRKADDQTATTEPKKKSANDREPGDDAGEQADASGAATFVFGLIQAAEESLSDNDIAIATQEHKNKRGEYQGDEYDRLSGALDAVRKKAAQAKSKKSGSLVN